MRSIAALLVIDAQMALSVTAAALCCSNAMVAAKSPNDGTTKKVEQEKTLSPKAAELEALMKARGKVVYAKRDIKEGHTIMHEDLEYSEMDQSKIPLDAVPDIPVTTLHLAQKSIPIGQLVRQGDLSPLGAPFRGESETAEENRKRNLRRIVVYNRDIALNPKDEDAYYNRGAAYECFSQYQKAIDDYGKAINLKQNHSESYRRRAHCFEKLGRYRQAVNDYSELLRLDGDPAPRLIGKLLETGYQLTHPGSVSSWIDEYTKQLLSDDYRARAHAYESLGEYQEAINDCKKLISQSSTDPYAYVQIGDDYEAIGQHQAAIDNYTKAISLSCKDQRAYIGRAKAYDAIGQSQKAAEDRKAAQATKSRGASHS